MFQLSKTVRSALLAYALLAFAAMIPLVVNGRNPLIGNDGAGLALWATWWPAHAIPNNYDLVYGHYIGFPTNSNLLPVLSLTSSLFYSLLRPFFGAVWAYNLLLPLYTFLNATATYLYIRRHTSREWYAALAGGVLALNPITYELARGGNLPLMGFFAVILWLLLWDRFMEKPSFRRTAQIVIGLYAITLMSMQFWSLIVTVCLPYALYHLMQLKERKAHIDALLPGALGLAILLFIYPVGSVIWSSVMPRYPALSMAQGAGELSLLAWVFLIAFARLLVWGIRRLGGNFRERGLWLVIIGLNLVAYVIPSWSPLGLLGIVAPEYQTRPLVLWLPILLAGMVLVVKSLDDTPLPYSRRTWAIGVVALVILSAWWQPLPSTALDAASFYDTIAADPEDYLIADYPMGADGLERRLHPDTDGYGMFGVYEFAGRALMDTVSHQKPVIGGLTTRLTATDIQPFDETPLLELLGNTALEEGNRETAARIRADVARWRVGYMVVHLDQLTPDFADSIHRWLTWTNAFCYVTTEGSREFWRATWHPGGCPPFTLRVGEIGAAISLGDGWYTPEDWGDRFVRWAGGTDESQVTAWLNPQVDYELRIRVTAPQTETQRLTVIVNGEEVGEEDLQADWGEYTFTIPRELIEPDGFVSLTLRHSEAAEADGRTLTAAYEYLTFQEVES
jgi:hypothetical protein